MSKRIKVKAIHKKELSSHDLALVFLLMAKRHVEEKRQREAAERAQQREAPHGA